MASTKYANMDLGKKGGLIAPNSADHRHQQFLNKVRNIASNLRCLTDVSFHHCVNISLKEGDALCRDKVIARIEELHNSTRDYKIFQVP